MPSDRDLLATARERLRSSQKPRALTGAGASAESGIPTFRGPGGLWRSFRPEELATPEAFARDPRTVWEWYDWRRGIAAKASPNPCHDALAGLEKSHPGFWLVTQNVDGLHRRAGSTRLLELHGDIWRVRCTRCPEVYEDARVPLPIPPACRACASLVRPDIVWFGECLPEGVIARSFALAAEADVFLVIGTSGVVEPAASLARAAKAAGAFLIEINPEPSVLTPFADAFLQGSAGQGMASLLRT